MPNRYIPPALVQAMQTLLKTLSKPLSTFTTLDPYLYAVFIANSAGLGGMYATFQRVYGEAFHTALFLLVYISDLLSRRHMLSVSFPHPLPFIKKTTLRYYSTSNSSQENKYIP